MLTLDDKVVPKKEAIVTELDDEAVLLHLDTKMYFSLNATGLWIWKRLEKEMSLKEISVRLEKEFAVTQEKAQDSVLKLAQQLQTEKLVDIINA